MNLGLFTGLQSLSATMNHLAEQGCSRLVEVVQRSRMLQRSGNAAVHSALVWKVQAQKYENRFHIGMRGQFGVPTSMDSAKWCELGACSRDFVLDSLRHRSPKKWSACGFQCASPRFTLLTVWYRNLHPDIWPLLNSASRHIYPPCPCGG